MRQGRTFFWCVVTMLAACGGDAKPIPAASTVTAAAKPAATQRGPTPEQQTKGMVEAATVGTSTVPVALKFDLTSRPVVNQPLEVVIAVMPQIAAVSASVQISGSDGLQLANSAASMDIAPLEATQVYRESIKMTPLSEGVQLLNLSIALKHDDIVETRAFSLPIIVAPGSESPAPKH